MIRSNLNAYAERFVRSVKTECTGRMVFFSQCAGRDLVGYSTIITVPPP